MKKIKYFNLTNSLLFCLLLLASVSCNDFLEIAPPSQISPESYLTAESHLAAYTIARYPDIFRTQALGSDNNGPFTDDTHTDNQATRSYNNRFVPGQWKVGQGGGNWGFGVIYQLNYFLDKVTPRYQAGTLTGSLTNIKHYIGEAYMMRAAIYFEKLKEFGDYPIITSVVSNDKASQIDASKRSPRTDVARFIIANLDTAVKYLNDNPDGGKRNRITKTAAYLLKSRVALFEGTWLKYHQGTALVPNGTNWPGASKEYNKSYQFKSGSISKEIEYFLTESKNAAKIVADAVALESNTKKIRATAADNNPYYDMFASNDLSNYKEILFWRAYDATLSLGHSSNHYFQYNGGANGFTRGYVDNFLMQNGLPIYATGSGYAGDDYIADVKTNRDWRIQLFMKAPGEVKALANLGTAPVQTEGYPNIYVSGTDGKNNYATGYPVKKGLSYDFNQQNLSQCLVGSVIYRSAEAYLNYIEASYELTGALDADAIKYWKALRNRAGVSDDINATIAATVMTEEAKNDWGAYSRGTLINATLYNIRRERRSEFIADGMRWPDLIRWRALDQLATNPYQIEGFKLWGPMERWYDKAGGGSNLTASNVSSKTLSVYLRVNQIVTSGNLAYDGYKWSEPHYLSPIAVDHFLLTTSDGVTISTSPIYQNPGWPTTAGAGPTTK
jgi:starch-binding outer membrane protein, SusD/RagB family